MTLLARIRSSPEALRGAVVLIAATVVALVWANLPGDTYSEFWHLLLGFELGEFTFSLDLRHWVNDALMAVFFAHVTLEVRRELELGELRDWRRASVPVIAALAGLVIPGLFFVGLTWGSDAVGGWGIVVSTDTAFVLGMLALVGRAMPPQLRVFLVTLAVADDVGALGVIAFAYTDHFTPLPLALAVLGLIAIGIMRWLGVWRGILYLIPSVLVWVGFLLSGVHATLAGVAIAFLLPIFPTRLADLRRAREHVRAFQISPSATSARSAEESLSRAVSVNERAHRMLAPYVTWMILPVFALANAGVRITGDSLADAFASQLTWAVILGLVVGKIVAITASTWIVTRVRPGALGGALGMRHILALSTLAGMGFTISLFVTELAFDDPLLVQRAQIGVLSATAIAAVLGSVAFGLLSSRERRGAPDRTILVRPLDQARDHVLGDPAHAAMTVVQYGNYGSPFMPTAAEVRSAMQARFGRDIVYAYRHLPLDEPLGRDAALAAEAAGAQGRFWEFHDEIIREAPIESDLQMRRAAARAGLNLRRFEEDRRRGIGRERLEEDIADAAAMRLEQAPTFFIGSVRYEGPFDEATLTAAVAAGIPSPQLSPSSPSAGGGVGGRA